MGLADSPAEARSERPGVPQIALVSPPQSFERATGGPVAASETTLTSRIFTTGTPHHAYAMTGAMCVAAAARLPGTVARAGDGPVTIGHPKGTISVDVTAGSDEASVERVTVGRTIRPIVAGRVFYRADAL